ncbi:Flp family type IVb pilin [Vibrio variabilis]|uniref:Flp family type IVb pilin n=1 Tax=Vibrio variabilis TaxID=990271 RepID=UPI000DDBF54B|nr:Flp family type IVb pilin [Vibrio variabilis]
MMTKLYEKVVTVFYDFKQDERGVTAIEYGLIAAAMAAAIAAAFAGDGTLITNLKALFTSVGTSLQ